MLENIEGWVTKQIKDLLGVFHGVEALEGNHIEESNHDIAVVVVW